MQMQTPNMRRRVPRLHYYDVPTGPLAFGAARFRAAAEHAWEKPGRRQHKRRSEFLLQAWLLLIRLLKKASFRGTRRLVSRRLSEACDM